MPKKVLCVLCSALLSLQSFADDSDGTSITVHYGRDNVVVYGVRIDQPLTETGSSVSIISADVIESFGVDYAVDAIATAPGVTINQNGAFGGSAAVRIRGASSEQTLVIIDGVVANDPTSPGGGFNFARLDVTNIERIEVLKGAQSTLWGTDAIGGVVNIITKRPEEGVAGNVFAQGGSYGSFRGGADLSGATDRYDFRLSGTLHSADGISKADEDNGNSEQDEFESNVIAARGALNLPAEGRLEASLLWTDAEAEFDSFSFGDQGNLADGDELSATEELTANLSLNLPLFDGKFENMFLVGYSDIERNNFSNGQPSFSSEGDRKTFRYQGTVSFNESNRLAFGAEREDSEANGDETSIDGVFALYEFKPSDVLTVTAGVRRDDHERYGGETTSRLAMAYNPHEQITLSASWGEGFKAPTIFQTTFFCCGATTANADLRPETSEAFDVGLVLRSNGGRAEIGVTYFDQDTTDLIDFSFAIGGYQNISRALSSGFELYGEYQFSDWLEVGLSYAYIDAEDGFGEKLSRVPEHSGDVTFFVDPEGPWSGNVLIRHNGEEQDPNGLVDSWTRIDVSGRYALSDTVEIYARIENLFDEEYQQILGYGTPDLSGIVGIRLGF